MLVIGLSMWWFRLNVTDLWRTVFSSLKKNITTSEKAQSRNRAIVTMVHSMNTWQCLSVGLINWFLLSENWIRACEIGPATGVTVGTVCVLIMKCKLETQDGSGTTLTWPQRERGVYITYSVVLWGIPARCAHTFTSICTWNTNFEVGAVCVLRVS